MTNPLGVLQRWSGRYRSRLATVGLAPVLVVLAGFSLWGAVRSNAAARQVNRDTTEQDVWQMSGSLTRSAPTWSATGRRPASRRWQHPEHGLVPPDEFIPLAERTGLIGPNTHYVLDEALRQGRRWSDAGHELSVAVNVSARRMLDLQFPDEGRPCWTATSSPPSCW